MRKNFWKFCSRTDLELPLKSSETLPKKRLNTFSNWRISSLPETARAHSNTPSRDNSGHTLWWRIFREFSENFLGNLFWSGDCFEFPKFWSDEICPFRFRSQLHQRRWEFSGKFLCTWWRHVTCIGSPLRTMSLLWCGRSQDVLSNDQTMLDRWQEHVASLIANKVSLIFILFLTKSIQKIMLKNWEKLNTHREKLPCFHSCITFLWNYDCQLKRHAHRKISKKTPTDLYLDHCQIRLRWYWWQIMVPAETGRSRTFLLLVSWARFR